MPISQSFNEAKEEIFGVFETAWAATGYNVVWPNRVPQDGGEISDQTATAPTGQEPWARVWISHGAGDEVIGRVNGQRRYTRRGQVVVQVHTPLGSNMGKGYELAKLVVDAYEGYVTPAGVWFRNARIREVGGEGNSFVIDIFVDFEYDEVK